MPIQRDRRFTRARRVPEGDHAPLQRKNRDRRGGERRDSERVARTLTIFTSEYPLPLVCKGFLSVGGAQWRMPCVPRQFQVELRFRLPDQLEEVGAHVQILDAHEVDGMTEIHAKFLDMDLKTELAIARLVHSRSALAASLDESVSESQKA
jgi:hypothetical protein